MQYAVEGECNLAFAHAPKRIELLFVHLRSGNAIGQLSLRSLDADLDVIEPVIEQAVEQVVVKKCSLCDQVCVKAGTRCVADKRREVATQRWFTAREMRLNHARFGRIAQDGGPLLGRELVSILAQR